MDIITIIVLTGLTNLAFAMYSWQQVHNPESHSACKAWAQAYTVRATSYIVYAVALLYDFDTLRLFANLLVFLGCWAEVRAYKKLTGVSLNPVVMYAGFMLTAVIFTTMHFISGDGPNNTMVIVASILLIPPLMLNVILLYRLRRQYPTSVFPPVLLTVNGLVILLWAMRAPVAFYNPDFIVTNAELANQVFMFATFIHGLGTGIGFIGFLKERSDEKLCDRANYDYLTGIHNRQHFERIAQQYIESGRAFTLYFMDIDRFKSVNDRFGHATGDQVLQLLSNRLRQLEESDAAVAGRLGGEEFGLILPAATQRPHRQILAELTTRFAQDTEQLLGEAQTFCLGACASTDANTVHDLMSSADVLLYDAKRKLKNLLSEG